MARNEVSIELSVETKEAIRALNKFDNSVDNTEKNAKQSASIMDRAFASFAGNLAAISVGGAFRGAIDGFRKLASIGGDLVNAASVQEDAINALNSALLITGKNTAGASEEIQKFASEMQGLTKFGDEVILQNAALIQSLGNLETDALKGATKAAIDMAAALGIDLASAATLVGKAAAGEIGSLSSYGVIVKRGADNAVTVANTLEALGTKFGGAAAAQVKTFSGATQQLSNTFGDLQETLGFTITQSPVIVAAIKGLEKGFSGLIQIIDQNKESIRTFAEEVLLNQFALGAVRGAAEAVIFFNKVLVGTDNFFSFIADAALATGQTILEFSSTVVGAASSLKEFFGISKGGVEDFKGDIDKQIESIKRAREAGEEATAQRLMDQQELENAINGVTDTIINSVQTEVAAVQAKNAKIIESETKKTQKVKELKQSEIDAKKAADLAEQEAQALKDVLEEERFQMKLEKNTERFGAERALEIEHQTRLAEIRDGERAANSKRRELEAKAETKALKDQEKRNRDSFFAIADYQKLSNKQRVQNLQGTLGTIATLSSSSNKTLFNIGKAAGIANATIDGIAAVQKALASAPPPFNLALAALVGTATAANVAKLSAAKPPAYANGGFVGGAQGITGGGDNRTITARTGELFLNGPQQRTLFEGIQSGNLGGGNSELISAITALANRPVMVEIEGRAIAQAVRDERLAGFAV